METSTSFKKQVTNTAPVFFALACAALTGCFSDSGTNPDTNPAYASISGQVQGDVGFATSGAYSGADTGWQGTMITAFAINTDGSLGAAQDSVMASANGTFTLQTTARGNKEWILRARRGTAEWMARFEGTLEDGQTETSRPLNLESTLEASVLLELKKTAEGREVHSSEVNLAIDANASASASGEYRGTETQRNLLVARLAASVKAASRARHAYLTTGDSLYTSKRASIDSARATAEDTLTASLYAAAADTARIHTAERAFVTATVNAYVKLGVGRVAYARSSEASYHAMLRNSVLLTDSVRTTVARNYAHVFTVASDTAMRSEFSAAGSSLVRSALVSAAGVTFAASVEVASSRAQIDTAVVRYRTGVRAAFNSVSDTTFNIFNTVASEIAVVSMTDSLSLSLTNVVGASSTGEAVGTAYATAQLSAQSSLRTRIQTVNTNDAQARAAAYVLAFLSVRSSLN